jgi:hypothetical protein
MLKQNLTKVIAVATIAAAGVFVSGCAEETVEDPTDENEPMPEGEEGNPDKGE